MCYVYSTMLCEGEIPDRLLTYCVIFTATDVVVVEQWSATLLKVRATSWILVNVKGL